MAELTLFKNRKGRVNVASPDGQLLKFTNGMFFTHNKDHEEFLKKCAERKECGVYIDPNQPTIDLDAMSPHDMLRAKIIREYEEDKAKAARANAAPAVNPGDTTPSNPQQSVANTTHTATPQVTPPQAKQQQETSTAKVKVPEALEAAKSGEAASKK